MGQNETTHPHDATVASGPLWCVPVAAGVIAVWHGLSSDLELVGVEGGAGLLTPLERHRIFSPQFSKSFYAISSHGLQDGRRLRVILRDADGNDIEQALDLRLAHWQVEGTPQIVSFIIARILPKHDASGDHETLERFLSLVSSWRAVCRLSAQIGSHSLYSLDVAARYFAQRQTCFVVKAGRLTRETLNSFGHGDKSVFMTSKGRPERAYADLGGDLVEIEFSPDPVAEPDTPTWLQGLSLSAKNVLLDHLSAASAEDRSRIPAYVTASLKTAAFPLSEPASEIVIRGCFQASGTVFAFLEVAGATPLESIRLELFGSPAGRHLVPDLLTNSIPSDATLPKSRIVAKVAVDGHQASACKIIVHVEGRSIQQWIHIQAGDTRSSLGFVRDFWPLSDRDVNYLTDVGAPFARAWAQRSIHEPAQAISLSGRRSNNSVADLQIVAGARLEALHGTLLAVKSSVPCGQAISVTLPPAPGIADICSVLGEWGRRYELDGEIHVAPAHAPASAAANLRSRPSARAVIAVRAGFIPPRAGWMGEIVDQIAREPETFFVGVAPTRLPTRLALGELGPDTLLDLLAHDAIVAVAASVDLVGRTAIDQPVCHTLAGAWIERLIEGARHGAKAIPHAALAFLEMDVTWDRDTFGARIDEIALSRKLAATEHREAPVRLKNVLSA